MFPMLAQDFKSDLPSVVQFTGVTVLVLGFSNFIWYRFSGPVAAFLGTDYLATQGFH